eukprot:scaffold16329_cov121-Isochrysis_galbana.AAC.10
MPSGGGCPLPAYRQGVTATLSAHRHSTTSTAAPKRGDHITAVPPARQPAASAECGGQRLLSAEGRGAQAVTLKDKALPSTSSGSGVLPGICAVCEPGWARRA